MLESERCRFGRINLRYNTIPWLVSRTSNLECPYYGAVFD